MFVLPTLYVCMICAYLVMTLIEGERSKVVSSQEATKSVDKEERSNLIDKKESNELTDQVDVKSKNFVNVIIE